MDERVDVENLWEIAKGNIVLVRMRGLEPPHLAAPEPKSGVSTNFTTHPMSKRKYHQNKIVQLQKLILSHSF